MSRFSLALLVIVCGWAMVNAEPPAAETTLDLKTQKDALARWNSLIGGWRGTGQPRRGSNTGAWREDNNWAWSFTDKEAALLGTVTKGKLVTSLRITASGEAGLYHMEWVTPEGQNRQLTGKVEESKLVVSTTNPDEQNEVYRITLTPLNEQRTLILFEKKKADQQSYSRIAEVGYTREGARIAGAGGGGPECVVTGGLGTIKVQHAGKTYYVCCSGCQQAFNDDPEGILAEYKARREKEKASK